jgi:hypothetical protein
MAAGQLTVAAFGPTTASPNLQPIRRSKSETEMETLSRPSMTIKIYGLLLSLLFFANISSVNKD